MASPQDTHKPVRAFRRTPVACVRARSRDRNSGLRHLWDRRVSGARGFGAGAVVWHGLASTSKIPRKQDNVRLTRETLSTSGPGIVRSRPRRRGRALYLSSLLGYSRSPRRFVRLDFGRRIAHHVAAPPARGVSWVGIANFSIRLSAKIRRRFRHCSRTELHYSQAMRLGWRLSGSGRLGLSVKRWFARASAH
jgi:hypothetical protein